MLDNSRHFGEIHGCPLGRRYIQDGAIYREDGSPFAATDLPRNGRSRAPKNHPVSIPESPAPLVTVQPSEAVSLGVPDQIGLQMAEI